MEKQPQRITTKQLFIGALFIGLLLGAAMLMLQMKDTHQLLMLVFGIIALVYMFARPNDKVNIPFYLLFTGLLIISYGMVIREPAEMFNPNDGWTVVNGERKRVMQVNWAAEWLSYILAPLTIAWYDRQKTKNRKLEIGLCAGFVLVAALICVFG